MHICYAADDNFCMQTGVSMLSLTAHTEPATLTFHLLDAGISPTNYQRLDRIARQAGAELLRYDIRPWLDKIRQTGQKMWGDFPTHATWARLFLPELLPSEVDRVLYLDGDVICTGDVDALYCTNLQGACLGGAEDCVSRQYKADLGFAETEPYLNAGVLLLDMNTWRQRYDPHWPQTFLCSGKAFPMADQDVINLMFRDSRFLLPLQYNYSAWYRALDLAALRRLFQSPQLCRYTRQDLDFCRRHAVLIHYNSCSLLVRPWYRGATDPAWPEWKRLYDASEWGTAPLPEEPPRMNTAEQKDRRLYQKAGRRWFSVLHSTKRFLNSLRPGRS